MKQSYGRLLAARLMSPAAAVGMAAAAVAAFAACHNNSNTPCPNLSQASAVLGQTDFVTSTSTPVGPSTMASPQSVGYDPVNGVIYVADTYNNRVLGFTGFTVGAALPANGAKASFVLGQPCFEETQNTGATNTAGPVTTIPSTCSSDSAATTTAYGLYQPTKVWVDPTSDKMVITDSGNNRVLIFDAPPTSASTAPTVIVGQTSITANSANQGSGSVSAVTLSAPSSAIITNGQLAVADKGNNRVLIWSTIPTADGTVSATDELGQLAYTSSGDICTTNSGGASSDGYCFSSNTTNIGDQYIAATTSYQVLYNAPTDLWSSGSAFYVTDSGDNRVLVYSSFPAATTSTSASPYNQQPSYILGQTKFNNITSASGSSGLFAPGSVFSDGSNNLFVADTDNNRVLQYTLAVSTMGQAAVDVVGQEDFAHTAYNDPDQNNEAGDQRNNPPTLNPVDGTLWFPGGVFASSSLDLLFIADTNNDRVLIYPEDAGVNGTYPNLCS